MKLQQLTVIWNCRSYSVHKSNISYSLAEEHQQQGRGGGEAKIPPTEILYNQLYNPFEPDTEEMPVSLFK